MWGPIGMILCLTGQPCEGTHMLPYTEDLFKETGRECTTYTTQKLADILLGRGKFKGEQIYNLDQINQIQVKCGLFTEKQIEELRRFGLLRNST